MAIIALNSAATGLRALSTRIDVVANNLANAETTAFKRSRVNFEDLMYLTIKELSTGSLKGGVNRVFGLAEGAIDIAPFHQHDSLVPAEVKRAVATAKTAIASGKIKVPATLAELGISK